MVRAIYVVGVTVVLSGCAGLKQQAASPQPPAAPSTETPAAPIKSDTDAIAYVNSQMERAKLVGVRCKALAKNAKDKLPVCQDAYDEVFISGRTLTQTGSDLLAANRWDSALMSQLAMGLDSKMKVLRTAAGQDTSGKSLAEVGAVLIDLFFRIYDGYKTREKAERDSLAKILREKAWVPWEKLE